MKALKVLNLQPLTHDIGRNVKEATSKLGHCAREKGSKEHRVARFWRDLVEDRISELVGCEIRSYRTRLDLREREKGLPWPGKEPPTVIIIIC